MLVLPKLKVTKLPVGYPKEEIMELEEAVYRLNFNEATVLAEGRLIRSHEELVQLADEANFRDKQFIEVTLIVEFFAGG